MNYTKTQTNAEIARTNRAKTAAANLMAEREATSEVANDFIEAIRGGTRAICDIDTAVRSDMLPQLTAMALKAERKLTWNPVTETFGDDAEANALLAHRPFRGDWKLPTI
jgi:hypothetical protein